MKNLLYWLISLLDSNSGYLTQRQKRFNIGDTVTVTRFKDSGTPYNIGEEVVIVEHSRYDYLVTNRELVPCIVCQFEITDEKVG